MPTRGSTPIAAAPGDSSIESAWQAEPVEAATSPSAARTSAPGRPTNETLSVFGSRSSGGR